MSLTSKSIDGQRGEQVVAAYLQKEGFAIYACNFKKRWCGEIDVIAGKKELLVFVEVKARTVHPATIAELIPLVKQHKIIATARHYLAQKQIENKIIRFDVALVYADTVEYIANAFTDYEQIV